MHAIEYRSLTHDDRRWVRATELGTHATESRAATAARKGLTASYKWRVVTTGV